MLNGNNKITFLIVGLIKNTLCKEEEWKLN